MKLNAKRLAVKAGGAVVAATACLSLFGATGALAAGTPSGTATFSVQNGGSATSFGVSLPTGAACSADTASGNYHVFSYIVPSSVNPANLTFNSNGPVDPGGNPDVYTLYDTTGTGYGPKNTAPVTGQIQTPLPQFNFASYNADGSGGFFAVPPGSYNIGIACATGAGAGDKFWNNVVTFTASGTDPNGEVWAVNPGSQVPESPLTIALPLTAVAVLGGGVLVIRRRRSHNAPVAA